MKIYFSVNDLYNAANPYTWTLADGFKRIDDHVEIAWGHAYFWSDEIFSCDVVHIHWPEQLLLKDKYTSQQLRDRILQLKISGVVIAATCHNLVPHKNKSDNRCNAYNEVYANADLIFHLGQYSYSMLCQKFQNAKHVVIQHHVYDHLYKVIPSKDEALNKLHLSSLYKYILCFGQFRDDEERAMVIDVYKKFKQKGYRIIAPGFAPVSKRKNLLRTLSDLSRYYRYSILYPGIIKSKDFVPDDLVPYYYAASDISFIQRKKLLNSGNLPLALYMGNIVVGGYIGNLSDILNETGNPGFNPDDMYSVISAVSQALEMPDSLKESNRAWALKNMGTDVICQKIMNEYSKVIENKKY